MPKSEPVYRLWPAFIENVHDVGIGVVWPGIEPVREATCLDLNLLQSASEQPYQYCFGQELYPTLAAKAAYLFVHIAGGHIFSNGNKRTAVLCLDMFFLANARYLTLTNDQVYRLACFVASAGEKNIKFDRLLAFVIAVLEKSTIPLSAVRPIDKAMYRSTHKQKNWVRHDPLNQRDAPLRQRNRD